MGWILLVVISMTAALAQIVMKYAADASSNVGIFNPKVLAIIFTSFLISCAGQLLWFYALRFASLGTSYLFLSLVFVLVPLAGWWLFSETLQPLHFLSMALILSGVAVLGLVGRGG
ncbi:EamA family transporter [Devosia sp. A8/3-2]|nr:EamA family transporter [Devosia sp. A8/3-2]